MAHRVAFTRLLLAGSHSAVVVPPRSSSGCTHSVASKGQRCSLPGISSRDGAARPCRHPADAQLSTQEVMPPPQLGSLRQGSSKGVFFPHWWWVSPPPPWVTTGLLRASQPAGTLCRYSTATQGRPTWANAPKQGRAYHQRALGFQRGHHRGEEDKDVPRDTTTSTRILEPHPAAGPMHTLLPR